ncbi:hypothetical protein JW905_13935, partial [bacterium]|nr:hypothetical protein [candidate division CSSED10-310 bacterium]
SIGDELRITIRRRIQEEFDRRMKRLNGAPDRFMDMTDLARLAFDTMIELKHRHTDQELRHTYGFSTAEFVAGSFKRDGREVPIKDAGITEKALELISPNPEKQAPNAVFNNAGILAGYAPESGYRIFLFSMREQFVEPVECGFVSQGSGGDSTNFVMPRLFNSLSEFERDNGMDRLDGLRYFLTAILTASHSNLGVGGYFNLFLFDGRAAESSQLLRQVNDHRIKLGCEIVHAADNDLLAAADCRELLDRLYFNGNDLDEVESRFFQRATDMRTLHRLLRGYPVR